MQTDGFLPNRPPPPISGDNDQQIQSFVGYGQLPVGLVPNQTQRAHNLQSTSAEQDLQSAAPDVSPGGTSNHVQTQQIISTGGELENETDEEEQQSFGPDRLKFKHIEVIQHPKRVGMDGVIELRESSINVIENVDESDKNVDILSC